MDTLNPTPPPRNLGAVFGLKFYRYRAIVRRHWWIVAVSVGLCVGYQAWCVFTKPDLFQSAADLMVRPEITGDDRKIRDPIESLYGDTLKMLQSSEVLEGAKRRLDLEKPELSGNVDIVASVAPRTSIFTVTGTGTDPEYTRRFVDAVIDEFIAFRKSQLTGELTDTSVEISSQLNRVRKDLEKQKADFQKFIQANNMQFWQAQAADAAKFLSDLKTRQAQLTMELQRLENLTPDQLLTAPPPNSQSTTQGSSGRSTVRQDTSFSSEMFAQYLQATQALTQKQADVEYWSTVWKPKHPKFQALQREVSHLQRTLEVIKRQTEEATKARIVAITAELKSLDVNIAAQQQKVDEASVKDAEYQSLQGAVQRTQALEEKLVDRLVKVDPNTGVSGSILKRLRKAGEAVPVPKGTAKHLILGLLGGLVVGGIALFCLDRTDDRVSSSSEIIEHFSEPILGQIPNVTDSRNDSGLPLLQPEDERYAYAEAFRSLRSSLIFMPNQADLKTILVTSAIPNEGKSTVASNLGITMAASAQRVLLVDADLRRGDLASLFDTDGRHGLSTILRGEIGWRSAVRATHYPTLSLIPRGPVTNQSGELLLKPALQSLLEEFKEAYDLVIFNTAPILATDDTPTLAPHFDGALMVVRAQFTSARLTQNALNALYQRQVNVLGLILNCLDTNMPDYYYYQYPKYYAA